MSKIKVDDIVRVVRHRVNPNHRYIGLEFEAAKIFEEDGMILGKGKTYCFYQDELEVIHSPEDEQTIAELDEMLGYFIENK